MRHPAPSKEEQEHFQSAVTRIAEMENQVRFALRLRNEPSEPDMVLATLNFIQVTLEEASSALSNKYGAGGAQ